MRLLKIARDRFGFKDVWSFNGRITCKDSTSTKPKSFYGLVVKRIVSGKRKHFLFRIIVYIVKLFVRGKEYV